MATNNNQNDKSLPSAGNTNNSRSASDLIPKFFRTEANKKFLQGTIDQLIQPGEAEKINGYVGRKTAKAYKTGDNYIGDVSPNRVNYQLEPAAVIKDNLDNVTFYKDYNDYIGMLGFLGANTANESRLNSSDYYPWNPNIDWDKFTNFREYYWAPNGPLSVNVRGQSQSVISTYTVTLEDQGDNIAYVFNDGLTRNPSLKLYRGQTYRFEIDTPGHPMAISISRTFTPGSSIITAGSAGLRDNGLFDATLYDSNNSSYDVGEFIVLPDSGSVSFDADNNVSTLYPDGIVKLGEAGESVAVAYIEKGVIEFTIPTNAPNNLYYISKNSIDTSGLIKLYDIEENTILDIGADILGKKDYTSANGVTLSNGMKLKFQGDVLPIKYAQDQWYVEGVGDKIVLINEKDLIIPAAYSENVLIPFDSDQFDNLPFANASASAQDKDYLIINRASIDKNAWSRYNKWFHKDVLVKSYEYNDLDVNIDETGRAKRPIIEFEAGLKLFNFGVEAKTDIDLIDFFTVDAFSTIEGELGYNVDGINLASGMRILFAADTDIRVSGKIYEVKFSTINNVRQISLIETTDTTPVDLETIFVKQGIKYGGKIFHYHNNTWMSAQEKTKVNQPPLFDLCSPIGNAYGDLDVFNSSSFKGTKIFSYKEGDGNNDIELGFPLSYKKIENSGDIVFEFNLLSDTFSVQNDDLVVNITTDTANLKKYKNKTSFAYVNGWSSTPVASKQYVVKQYIATDSKTNNFEIDFFDKAGNLNDLQVIVLVNNKLQFRLTDYEIDRINEDAIIRFYKDIVIDGVVTIKAYSKASKNSKGYYELPINLERNPLNQDIAEFTLGEVIDHVDSMVGEIPNFNGVFPGPGNLRDLGDLDKFGKRFVKHKSPLNLSLYHLLNTKYNLTKALDYSSTEYSKFKRVFLETAESLGFDGETKQHVDLILKTINKDKIKTQPFYFSDMVAHGPSNNLSYTVLDSRIRTYALTTSFNLDKLSSNAVSVYLNSTQLSYGLDYTFDADGYIVINANQQVNDIIDIYEYESTDGTFVAPTPTKLGIYPKFAPELTIDDTYQTIEPTETGPYKIYGEVETGFTNAGSRGWFYPVYTTLGTANAADTANGGTGTSNTYLFKGLNVVLYMPTTGTSVGTVDNIEYDAYPTGIPFIKGHDGSYIRAYLDFRDELLLDLEKRIFNNIKVNYDNNIINIDKFVGGDFRTNEFTKTEVDRSLLSNFTQWLSYVDNDYTDNYFYDRLNPFTFNYSSSVNATGATNSGFWRGVYKRAFDTDRPHSHPWEMQGFKIKPLWWNTVYGPAPYTRDNLILWTDIQEGKIAEPNNIRYTLDYARPGLIGFIPVDSAGKLKHPQESGYVRQFILRQSTGNFSFGDEAPVETAWRRSSNYPFAIIKSLMLNKPSSTIGEAFDVSRITTNLVGQQVYSTTSKFLTLDNIVFPNTFADATRVNTSGFVNYIYNLVASDVLTVYQDYQTELKAINNQLGFKLGGFSDKQKINLILDSRSPQQLLSEGGIYIPQENYQVFLNKSSPQSVAVYSGIIIEKTASGFVIRGYNNQNPFFEYYSPITSSKTVPVTVGGISETTSEWKSLTIFYKDIIIENNNTYYRVTKTFTSADTFSTDNLAKLPELPIVGGKTALFKRNFDQTTTKSLPYGSTLKTSQDVVDFLLGYGQRLNDLGFDFNFVELDGTVNNWDQSAREFLFWTTQGWATGTVITISPAANKFNFSKDYFVVDDINDPFYTYSILQANGEPLNSEFNSLLRDKNSFGIQTVNTEEGLYSAALPLVQREHVVLIDNKTVFNDIVFEPKSGYRQERIKVSGYRAANWTGGLNIPGFVYDDAKVVDWTQWKDFGIGSLVKYKQFYYVATENIPGTTNFETTKWFKLNEKPEPELISNFDYRTNQFTDFYSLDTQGFDPELQKMAKHFTGFQKRQYLANIIPDDVSQYKFYQGFIQDKGTKNALSKMFSALGSAGKDTLEFYEEWALQVGRFGATNNIQQIEFNLKENKVQESPQAIELVTSLPLTNFDKHYRILEHEVHDKPLDYNHAPFPTKEVRNEVIKTGGFVREDDVSFVASSSTELPLGNVNLLGLGDYIWVTELAENPWNVYQHISLETTVSVLENKNETSIITGEPIIELSLNRWAGGLVQPLDIIGVRAAGEFNLEGLYVVDSVNLNKIKIRLSTDITPDPFLGQNFLLTKLRSVRVATIEEANALAQNKLYPGQRFWVENYNNNWTVLENKTVYSRNQTIVNNDAFTVELQEFSESMAATSDNRNLFVSSANDSNGKVNYYRRTNESSELVIDQEITPPDNVLPWKPNTIFYKDAKIVYDLDSSRTYYIASSTHTSADQFDDVEISTYWTATDSPITLFDPANSEFGKSIDVSPDGEYLIIGAPRASNVKTKFTGDFNTTQTYTKGQIVKYKESLWKANREILPAIAAEPFTSFDSYINISEQLDSDSTSLTLLVAGDPGLPNNVVDHFLVRAPKDMYNGTSGTIGDILGDGVSLYWNKRSFAYPTLDSYLPFDNFIPEITNAFLSTEHTIQQKIDHVFLIDTFVTLPVKGEIVQTDTGSAEVYYVSTFRDSAVVYLINTNGVFSILGELFNDRTDFVGFYSETDTYNTSEAVAGYWLFKTYQIGQDPTPQSQTVSAGSTFTYSNRSKYYDVGRGLVYSDIRKRADIVQQELINAYSNIQDTISSIGNYVTKKNQASFINHLSYLGDNGGTELAIPSSKYVIRTAKEYSDVIHPRFLANGPSSDTPTKINIKYFDNEEFDISPSGFTASLITGNDVVIQDMWDGYIDFDFTEFDFEGNVFEPEVGDILVDVQIPRDGQGGLARTSTITSAAEVMFYQRNFNKVRVYVNILTQAQFEEKEPTDRLDITVGGTFEQLTNIGRFEIRRLSRSSTDPDQDIGTILDVNNDIVVGTNFIGKLIVVDTGTTFSDSLTWDNVIPVTDQEYYFFNEDTITGISRAANPPYTLNKDYTQIYNILADKTGIAGSLNQGAVSIYRKDFNGVYQYQSTLVSEYAAQDKKFGSKVKITQTGNDYTLMISNNPTGAARDEDLEWRQNPGAIEIYKHGAPANSVFKGLHKLSTVYDIGDVVIWKDEYYIARKASPTTQDNIADTIYWTNISWKRAKDENFRGTFDNTISYRLGDIVDYSSILYAATTNVPKGAAVPSSLNTSWELVDGKIDYLGVLPNLTLNAYYNELSYDPATNISQFAESFDLSDDAEVLVVTTKLELSDSSYQKQLAIYRLSDKKYVLSQVIDAPASSFELQDHDNDAATPDVWIDKNRWAETVSLHPAGNKIAVSVPLDDTTSVDQGAVWVYNYNSTTEKFGTVNGVDDNNIIITVPNTVINSPNNEQVERFGYSVAFGKEGLAISSQNGDQLIPTRFDTYTTLLEVQPQTGVEVYGVNVELIDGVSLGDIKLDVEGTPIPVYSKYVLDTSLTERTDTTFDNKFTSFKNIKVDKGTIYVYEDIQDTLIYSEQLLFKDAQVNFGKNLLINDNHIYTGIPNFVSSDYRGIVLDYRKTKNKKAWNSLRSSVTPVDISKIEGVFLYNKRTNQIVSYIDYIDPVQGKIAGSADQEITFKTPLDPASYNVGPLDDITVSPAMHWGEAHVGQVWWNINNARFSNVYQGSTTFQSNGWNSLLPGASIDIYEWVESDYLPSQWNQLADTDNGVPLGISGTTLYGDTKYSAKLSYDDISQTFNTKYYFWVENKLTIPTDKKRKINCINIRNLIQSPRENGYRYISFISKDKLVLNNFDNLITSDDLVLNIRYSTGPNNSQNEHAQYQLISDNLATSKPNYDIERKWFDSLIGFDSNNRIVPDPKIPVAKRQGIQNRPRQGMFVNRVEALKQTIERVNLVLLNTLIADEYNINSLSLKDEVPTAISNLYDLKIDTYEELEFISTNKLTPAVLTPVVVNGRVVRVIITNPGRGYKVAPSYQFEGTGNGAILDITINNLGQIDNVEVLTQGNDYTDTTILNVRKFTVLVESDSTSFNKWSLYNWNVASNSWFRTAVQDYNVANYWNYVDWYSTGYNQFTEVKYTVNNSYELSTIDDIIGDTIKINNVGTGGWLLLEKESSQNTEDYTINYKTIGRQNGTIQFNDSLYDYAKNTTGYDNNSFDSAFYDNNPVKELRIIFEALRDDIFTGVLELEYNQLFFATLRYILSEQPSVDWMFKTSFISATHKLGNLSQDTTFKYSNLADFESYVNEVKPYSTNIREFVDSYQSLDNTSSSVADFDLAPYYNNVTGTITQSVATVDSNVIVGADDNTTAYPRKHWLDNLGYKITEIKISDLGSGYTFVPTVRFEGGGGAGATAKAVLAYGTVTKIIVTNSGTGYVSAPLVIIEGPQNEIFTTAKATAILGNGLVRNPHIRVKFDRLSGQYVYENIAKQTVHTGTGDSTTFNLSYPMDLNNSTIQVLVDNIEQLRSKYTYTNVEDNTSTYTREKGRIVFAKPPKLNAVIEIKYQLPLSMLNAEDRILHSYNPNSTMYSKDLTQLMAGIDYGGVEVRSFDFQGIAGWDSKGWFVDQWDQFDNTYEDQVFTADGSTIAVQLTTPLENGVVYNLYKNNVRIDASDYVESDTPGVPGSSATNINAITSSITGDGTTDIIYVQDLGISIVDGDIFVVRKSTSDGSVIPDPTGYDTALSGGDLLYTTASGTAAEDIITDGDGFISEAAMAGPEELVPGQIFDTLDIKVYTRDSDGQGKINSQSYHIDTSVTTYNLGVTPSSIDSVIVKINNSILSRESGNYTINWETGTVTIDSTITGFDTGAVLSIVTVSQAGQNILDYGEYNADGSTTSFETRVRFQTDLDIFVSVNGVKQTVTFNKSEITGNVVFTFNTAPEEGELVYYALFDSNIQVNYSQIKKDRFIGNGTDVNFVLSSAPFYNKPTQYNLIVKVGNTILSPGYNIQYTIPASNQREYLLETFQQPQGSLLTEDIKVFLNGEELFTPVSWRFDIANSSIILTDDVGKAGDIVEIYAITDGQYTLSSANTVTFNTAPGGLKPIEIFQFSNHDLLGIERINYDVVSRVTLQLENADYTTYNRLTVGEIKLRKPAIDAKYAWVVKNGELLTPDTDYVLTNNNTTVQLATVPEQFDLFDVIHFTAEVSTSKFAYRQFKDILNRTHYKRLDAAVTTLEEPLNYYDLRITVKDSNLLSEPNKGQNLPGIIFINGERIEYFVKEGNLLRQLRRGTLGTGVKELHAAESKVFDQNISKTIPYIDNNIVQDITADGTTALFDVGSLTGSINELEVFVGGVRMRKNSISSFLPIFEQDSPDGDYEDPADVLFNVQTQQIDLKQVPVEGIRVTIIKKQGKIWNEGTNSLGESENSIARFLRAGTSELPE